MRIEPRRQILEGWRELMRAELAETPTGSLPEFRFDVVWPGPDFPFALLDGPSRARPVFRTDEISFVEEPRPVEMLVPVVDGESCRARDLHQALATPGGELSPGILGRIAAAMWPARNGCRSLVRPVRIVARRHSLLAAAVAGRGVGYRGPVRETLVLLLRLICAALDLLFRGPPGVLLVDGARHCPGRQLAARPRVPRGPAAPGRLQPSSRGDVALAA